ncbi:MAG: hypothetical protein ACOYB8_05715 [Eubacteriaceae bacterium]|jgi:hypothetical protein
MNFMDSLTSSAWGFVPILLILFLFAGIMLVFYLKPKIDEITVYLKSIATSLEKLSDRIDPEAEEFRRRNEPPRGY